MNRMMLGCLAGWWLSGCNAPTSDGPTLVEHCTEAGDERDLGALDLDGDGVLTEADLLPGEAALQVRWTFPDGSTHIGRHFSDNTEIRHGSATGQMERYSVWFRIDCAPEASFFAVFEGPEDGVTETGAYPLLALSWDIPEVEQMGSTEDVSGDMALSFVDGDLTSGTLQAPDGEIALWDLLADDLNGAYTEERITIQALAFREIYAEFTH